MSCIPSSNLIVEHNLVQLLVELDDLWDAPMPMVCKAWRDVWYEIDAQIDAQRVKDIEEQLKREEARQRQLQQQNAQLQQQNAQLQQRNTRREEEVQRLQQRNAQLQ